MTSPRILVWDLENSPASGYFWGSTYKTDIIHVLEPSRVMSFAARWHGEKRVEYRSDFHDGHEAMVARAWQLLDEADAVVSYNGKGHDTPHINTEILMANDGKPPSPFVEIDLYQVIKRKFKFQQNRLNFVSRELEIGAKVAHEGLALWLKCMAGDASAWARFRKYNIGDVTLTDELYEVLLPWIPQAMHPNVGLFVEGAVCPKCGSDDLEKRGQKARGLSVYQQFVCRGCGSWSRSGKSLERVDLRGAS